MSINVQLFNTPSVTIEKKKVAFPFKKAEALFYYLIVKEKATRDELVNLFWGEIKEDTAKKNLRHAMYKIRKAFGMDIIISPQKSTVIINSEINIDSDINIFKSENTQMAIEVYRGEFLQGFNVKDGEKFEEWVFIKREQLKQEYINKLYTLIYSNEKSEGLRLVEKYLRLIINTDIYDEKAYRLLMNNLAEQGSYNKIIETYNKMESTLQKDLDVSPTHESIELYTSLLEKRKGKSEKKKNTEAVFFGRQKEMQLIIDNYNKFMIDAPYVSNLILGEAGVGKTRLKEELLNTIDKNKVLVLHSNCYQAEEQYYLKPWNDIFTYLKDIIIKNNISIPTGWENIVSQIFPMFSDSKTLLSYSNVERIDDFKYRVAEEGIIGILNKLSKKWKILFVFDDIQWMDNMSINLLLNIIKHKASNDIMFIATTRNGYKQKLEDFTLTLVKYGLLKKVELVRFSRDEVNEIACTLLPEYKWTNSLKKQVFQETEGNAFFLIELLNSLRDKGEIRELNSKAQDILKSRFIGVSEQGKKLLAIVSMFFDKASLSLIKIISNKNELELVDILDELQEKMILKESNNEDICFEFTHQKLREFIYQQQSLTRRRVLHNKIIEILENQLHKDKRDRYIYPKLIYHCKNSGSKIKEIKYRIKHLDLIFELNHELYPVISIDNIESNNFYIDTDEINQQLEEIQEIMKDIKLANKDNIDVVFIEMEYLHLKGRYLISEGEYDRGIEIISKMIEIADNKENKDFALKGYRQKIYYCIQTHNAELMNTYLEKGLKLAKEGSLANESAILLRLKGLNMIMQGEYYKAEELLKQAIALFNSINQEDNKYILNIAACFNYIGEIRRRNMRFSSALNYYDKAIQICESKRISWGLTIFCTNGGQSAFEMGDTHRAKAYLKKALNIYMNMGILWGRSTAEAYMALINIRDGEYIKALSNMESAEFYAQKLKSPYALGLMFRVKAEIKTKMKSNKQLNKVFIRYLNESMEQYCEQGIKYFQKLQEPYEIDILKSLNKNSG